MSDNIKYVRITPYNKPTGALAQRVSVDGKLFTAGSWYTLPAEAAEKLAKLKQGTGAPMFEVCDYNEYREAARRDLAAMAVAAGVQGLHLAQPAIPEPRKHSEKGERKSALAGIGKQIKDLEPSKDGVVTSRDVVPTREAHESVEKADELDEELDEELDVELTPDISKMKRPQLEALCKENGIKIPFGSSNGEIKQLLRDQGIAE